MNVLVSPHTVATDRARPLVRIVTVGHVDHGKSTLIGRLLHETGSLPDGKLENLKAVSARRGMPFEWSFLLDALQTERDQGITIDTTQIRFRTGSRDIVLIDAPGHVEFLRNMITGAAQADAAILIIDATEGVREQTRRHSYLLHLLGIRQVAVVINKMDRVDYGADRFGKIALEITDYLRELGVNPAAVIPISARQGDGVAEITDKISWYHGPTVIGALDQFTPAVLPRELPLRLPVQAIYKFDDRRIIVGRIESGHISVNDEIVVMPGAKRARVKSIERWPVANASQPLHTIEAGRSVGITLDREVFLERGNVLSLAATPAVDSQNIRARVFWLYQKPLVAGSSVVVRLGTAEVRGKVTEIVSTVDPGKLEPGTEQGIPQNHVGEVRIELARPIAADPHTTNPWTGRFALEIEGRIVGGGLILDMSAEDTKLEVRRPLHRVRTVGDLTKRLETLAPRLAGLSAAERIALLRHEISGRIVFTTSFGIEDQAILHMIGKAALDIEVVTIDTGRLFPQTYDLWAESERHFGKRIRAVYPHHQELEALIDRQGINGFYESRDARMACCFVRKVEPLNRLLKGAQAWIAGLRADQSANRKDMDLITADEQRDLIKLNPLFDWSRDDVAAFISENDVPINKLHDVGFASIGCAPCTRALRPDEPERAGRWWWEDENKKECGLHNRPASTS
jgi:sulfate adenylyltransferase large subunit/phosphoadenylyl-sulfate reductase (thioredoxin)